MGRFGDARFGGHMFGGGTAMGRVSTTHTGDITADAARLSVTLARAGETAVSSVVASSERGVALDRGSAVSMRPVAAAVARDGVSLNRSPSVYSGPLRADTVRVSVLLARDASNHTGPIEVGSSRAIIYDREAGMWTSPFRVDVERVASYDRTGSTHTGRLVVDGSRSVPHWMVDGLQVQELTDEVRDPEILELSFRAERSMFEGRMEQLDSDSGAVDVVVSSDGSFRAYDRAGGDNTYRLEPPTGRAELRETDDFHVDDFEAEVVDEAAQAYDVDIDFQADASREPSGDPLAETKDPGQWLFEFHHGDVATRRVKAKIGSKGEDGASSYDMELVLTHEQALAVEVSASYPDAVTIHEVSDGSNFAEDSSPDGRQTVTITGPDSGQGALPNGDYAVADWTTTWLNDDFVEVELEVTKI